MKDIYVYIQYLCLCLNIYSHLLVVIVNLFNSLLLDNANHQLIIHKQLNPRRRQPICHWVAGHQRLPLVGRFQTAVRPLPFSPRPYYHWRNARCPPVVRRWLPPEERWHCHRQSVIGLVGKGVKCYNLTLDLQVNYRFSL